MKTTKITVRQRLLLSLGLGGGGVALAFLPAAHPVSYIRYVSPPLPDGMRYTFLRPTYLANVSSAFVNSDLLMQTVRIRSNTSVLENLTPRQLRVLFSSSGNEEVIVKVGDAAQGRYYSRSTLPSTPDTHTENHGVEGGWIYHNVYMTKQKSGLSFCLQHSAGFERDDQTDNRSLAIFQCSDATIARSFRILPPGVAVPSP